MSLILLKQSAIVDTPAVSVVAMPLIAMAPFSAL